MTVKVEVRDGETVWQALRRLRVVVRHAYQRKWHKTRIGSYDKPSYRRRRDKLLRKRNANSGTARRTLKMHIGLTSLHARCAPFTYRRQRRND